MNIPSHNRRAWNKEAIEGSCWSQPVSSDMIAAAKNGRWSVVLTPTKPVPVHWFGELNGKKVLCLASGGGQQAPILAAAGAIVTSFDISDEQLKRDRLVSDRDGLSVLAVQGDMKDLSAFEDSSVDLVFHPVSNLFIEDIHPVWREAFRVLKPEGRLLSGFMNPTFYLFNHDEAESLNDYVVRYKLPFAEVSDRNESEVAATIANNDTLEFSHTLDDQIGGQLEAGFLLAGFYEDRWDGPLDRIMPTSMATLSIKPKVHQAL